jgi:GDP-mannose 6-dehydrogenase
MLGLSFKMNTDDLRESPNVELAERLIGKGFEVRIYDPIVNPERLIGSNLRYIESRLPHLRRLLAATPREALQGCDAAVVATSDPAVIDELRTDPPGWILDLHGRLGPDIERLTAYEGIGWAV